MICPNCGQEVAKNVAYCEYCGTSLGSNVQQTSPTSNSNVSSGYNATYDYSTQYTGQSQNFNQGNPYQQMNNVQEDKGSKNKVLIVVGIVLLVLFLCCCCPFLGIFFAGLFA